MVEQQHLTLVPLQLHLSEGRVKVLMALARGRKTYDKRQVAGPAGRRARGPAGHGRALGAWPLSRTGSVGGPSATGRCGPWADGDRRDAATLSAALGRSLPAPDP